MIARGRTVLHRAKRFKLKLELTKPGRMLLRLWRKRTLSTRLTLTVESRGGHRTHATRTIALRRAAPRHAR